MAKNTENNSENVENNDGKVGMSDIIVEQEDSTFKKVLKWTLGALACVATGVAGFFLGRATSKDDDDESGKSAENDDD